MKKSIRVIFVAMLVTLMVAFAGQAMAYFDQGTLIRVVWKFGGTYEVVTDLGKWDHIRSLYTGPNVLISSPAFSLSQLQLDSWENVHVAYFMRNTVNVDAWVSGETDKVQKSGQSQQAAFFSRASKIEGFNYQSGQQQNVNLQSNPNSFSNQHANYYRFGNFLAGTGPGYTLNKGYQILNSFDQPGEQYVDQYLYFYDTPNSAAFGVPILVLRTYETGMTEIRPIPIPPAAILLGTGLLGLIGIRRRMKDDVR